MKLLAFILVLVSLNLGGIAHAQDLSIPIVTISDYIFKDSVLVSCEIPTEGSRILMEAGAGENSLFKPYHKPFFVTKTKTLRFKLVHDELDDGPIHMEKVYKQSDLPLNLSNNNLILVDGKRGGFDLNPLEWKIFSGEKTIINFSTENKKLEEVEVLSVVNLNKNVAPPKKGEKVHLRTATTIGKFENVDKFWSHNLRLKGKPKLKKILRKTKQFSLEITATKKDDGFLDIYLDEILLR